MTATEKKKRSFRASKKWKDFRKSMMLLQNDIDPITKTKLSGKWCVHHRSEVSDNYEDISNSSDFIAILSTTHDVIHYILRYVKKEGNLDILHRLYKEIEKEAILNGYIK